MENCTLTAALNKFFGRLPGQTMAEFAAELKKLTQSDRDWFKAEFEKAGWIIT